MCTEIMPQKNASVKEEQQNMQIPKLGGVREEGYLEFSWWLYMKNYLQEEAGRRDTGNSAGEEVGFPFLTSGTVLTSPRNLTNNISFFHSAAGIDTSSKTCYFRANPQ